MFERIKDLFQHKDDGLKSGIWPLFIIVLKKELPERSSLRDLLDNTLSFKNMRSEPDEEDDEAGWYDVTDLADQVIKLRAAHPEGIVRIYYVPDPAKWKKFRDVLEEVTVQCEKKECDGRHEPNN